MKKIISVMMVFCVAVTVSACSKRETITIPDHDVIMDRTISMIMKYDEILAADDIKEADEDTLTNLTNNIYVYINQKPKPYNKVIGVEMKPDASFIGFEDQNNDNKKDIGEKKLFTMEVDVENHRLVYTDETGNHHGYRLSGSGFFLGAMWANMGNRQTRAGVRPNRFAGASVNTRDYSPRKLNAAGSRRSSSTSRTSTKSTTRSSARSSARSGGVRSGK